MAALSRARSDRVADAGSIGEAWFAGRAWRPFAFQREVWAAMAAGQSGLLHATTGSGKTYAVWFGALARAAARRPLADADARAGRRFGAGDAGAAR